MTKKDLHEYGELMFGPRFQPRLAAILSHYRGKTVSQAQVSQWLAGPDGQRDPPEWLEPLVVRAAIQMRHELLARAETLEALNMGHFRRNVMKHGFMGANVEFARDDDYVDPDATVKLPPSDD
ncbi:hypothetical protein OKC48_06835 [Methylorubrum extorquens]|uniref:hypothetical protein n=1 Tax=Methylorubrum extorquens TaxID=408 RepID=UPI002237457C|nr:hypothetical protein [Methylorubrum extorquens]UYW28230.1 hypothetical protein OKC48_06835 [Methylorubrum extorquens]